MNLSKRSTILVTLIGASLIGKLTSGENFESTARKSRFISFNNDGGKIDIDLDLSIPFVSIPLDRDADSDGMPGPLVNVNAKAIGVAGLMAALTTFIVPLLFKTPPAGQRYRLTDDFGIDRMGNAINEFILGNNYVTPCVERAVCTLVAKTTGSIDPTSTDKIIDGLTR
ncbi:uncharacterized protein [Venturia canescens]|uniref:uncharacterized protein n=1 Tax=Venturia canescens TaxID=32260 RepID=UPI001C9CF9AC|nr:uncharacterized protein LOC122409345 [Venturia canescens]